MTHHFPLILNENRPQGNVPVHIYSKIDDEYIKKIISLFAGLQYVNHPIVLLPDFHFKNLLETPSSSVILMQHFFCLALTSPSQNCGMSLAATPLSRDDISPVFLERFMSRIKEVVPLSYSEPVLTNEDVIQALSLGAKWAVKKFHLPERTLINIEQQGNLFENDDLSSTRIAKAVPDEIIEFARRRFCIIGGGNHFLELQVVDEIFDDTIAQAWGLRQNQVVVMLHTGSDALGAYLGRLYAFRKKTGIKQQFQFYRRKIRYLLLQPPLRSMLERISYYFMPGSFRFINPDTPEGKRVILAVNSGANFGFANRIAIINAVNSALKHISGENSCEARLLYDCSHNSIYKEVINGNKVWAHRHNACRAYPPSLLEGHPVFASTGQPIILPGTNQTSSFICAAKEGAAASHYTVDHGLGAIQKRHEESESLRQIGDHSYLFKYEKDMPEMVPIMTDDAVKEAVEILNQADIIQTVARLKPLATLKGPKSRVM